MEKLDHTNLAHEKLEIIFILLKLGHAELGQVTIYLFVLQNMSFPYFWMIP